MTFRPLQDIISTLTCAYMQNAYSTHHNKLLNLQEFVPPLCCCKCGQEDTAQMDNGTQHSLHGFCPVARWLPYLTTE